MCICFLYILFFFFLNSMADLVVCALSFLISFQWSFFRIVQNIIFLSLFITSLVDVSCLSILQCYMCVYVSQKNSNFKLFSVLSIWFYYLPLVNFNSFCFNLFNFFTQNKLYINNMSHLGHLFFFFFFIRINKTNKCHTANEKFYRDLQVEEFN